MLRRTSRRHDRCHRSAARLIVSSVVAVAWLAFGSVPSSAAVTRSFVGLQGWSVPSEADFQRIGRANVGYFRVNVVWADVEPRPGSYDWSSTDAVFARAAAAGVRVLPVMVSPPSWASSRPQWPPSGASARAAYARWVGAAVRRYGPGGAFWSEHPEYHSSLAAVYWQIWNEPSLPNYWNDRPSARQYGVLLRAASREARASSRRVRIVAAGLPESRSGIPIARYVNALERSRSTRRAFDVIAVHPYARDHRGVLGALDRVRRVLRRYRDARKRVWVTETGWGTGPQPDDRGFVTSEAGQAARLRSLFRTLWRKRRTYRLLGAVWFSYRDPVLRPGDYDWWAVHTGLFDANDRPKPAWRALLHVTGGSDSPP